MDRSAAPAAPAAPPATVVVPVTAPAVPAGEPAVAASPAVPPPSAAAPPALPFAQRFQLPAADASAVFPVWQPADCGCAPAATPQAYVFFPIAGQAAPAQVNFEIAARVAFFSLVPNGVGDIDIPEAWDAKAYANVAHRYAAEVDLVIAKDVWCSETSRQECGAGALELDKSYVLQNLVDEIADALKASGADGITIDFARVPAELHDAYHFFIKRLSKRLLQEGSRYRLNVVIHDLAELEALFARNKKTVNGQDDSKEWVDLFLIAWPGHGAETDTINELNNAFWKSGIPLKKAFVVLDATDKRFADKYALALQRDFGGVGVWALGQGKDSWEASVAAHLAQVAQQQDSDVVKKLMQKILPANFCKLICPNRDLIGIALAVAAGVYLTFLLLSLVVFEWRDVLRKYILYVVLIGIVLALGFVSVVICVPFWQGYQTEITVLLAAIILGFWIKSFRDKKREMTYP